MVIPFFFTTLLMVFAVLLTVDAFTFTVTLLLVVEDELFLLVFPPNKLEMVFVMLVGDLTLLAIKLPMAAVAAPITPPTVPATFAPAMAPLIVAAAPESRLASEEVVLLLEELLDLLLEDELLFLLELLELLDELLVLGLITVGCKTSPGFSVAVS